MGKRHKTREKPRPLSCLGHLTGRFSAFCALSLAVIGVCGCQSVPGGQGATAGAAGHLWLAGNGVRDYPVPKTVAAKAVQDTMTQMGMTTVRASHSVVESNLEYKALDGTAVGIHLEEEHPPAPEIAVRTVISVRVGAWGDDIKTDQIFLAISNALSLPVAPGEQAPGRLSPIAVGPTQSGSAGPVSNSIPGTVIYPGASPAGPFSGRSQNIPPNNAQTDRQPMPQYGQPLAPQAYPQSIPQNYPQGSPPTGGSGPLVPIPNTSPYPPNNPYPIQ